MINYFKPYNDYFWEWDTDDFGDPTAKPLYLASIPGNQTIAYFDAILETLEGLSRQGLPPFGSVLLVLIASSTSIQSASYEKFKKDVLEANGDQNSIITNALEVLEFIRNLPDSYKIGDTKTELIQLLFNECHNSLGKTKSNQIISQSRDGLKDYVVNQTATNVNNAIVEHDFRSIALIIRRFKSTQDIINAISKTPVNEEVSDQIIIEENLPKELVTTEKNFIEQLIDHDKTFQIGSLIKRIWSGLNIPMQNSLPSSQPLGGVSDISNKGNFDQLLLSEFANDEDTFMSRLVNNEALYIERETPPENNTKERIFLIDNSLKNWGIPKVLSFATTLAIATHPKSDFLYKVFVVGDNYTETPIATTLQVIESQHLLSGFLDCAKGLQAYFDEKDNNKSRELFFLTEEDNLNFSSLQNVIYSNYEAIDYIITNNINGDINFYKHQNKNRKHFQHIQLPYHDIWKSQLPTAKVIKPLKNQDIKIDHILLEPIDRTNYTAIPFENEIYIVQNDNLYTLTSKGIHKGLQLITENIPNHYYKHTIIKNEIDERILVSYSSLYQQVEYLNITTQKHVAKKIYCDGLENTIVLIYTSSNNVFLTNKTDFWSISKEYKIYKLNGNATYQATLFNHQEAIYNFKRQLKTDKINYNILKNINSINIEYVSVQNISIENFFMNISGFVLGNNKLSPKNKLNSYKRPDAMSKPLTPKNTLYLKRVNGNAISIIKYLRDRLKIDLKKSKEIIDNPPAPISSELYIDTAKELKKEIENEGATCFIKIDYYETPDGSTIHIKNGQLIFKSSNPSIPQFYISSVLIHQIAMATDAEFAGNDYFLPVNNSLTKINVNNFYSKYINPFIKHILTHED